MSSEHPITPPPPHLLKKFSAQAQDEAKKRNGAGYLKTFATLCIEWAMNSQPTPNDRQIRSSEICPPPELVEEWANRSASIHRENGTYAQHEFMLATQAARWGADRELEACCEWLVKNGWFEPRGKCITNLRAARRPKPMSLKEQALKELRDWTDERHGPGGEVSLCEGLSVALIREALESLPE